MKRAAIAIAIAIAIGVFAIGIVWQVKFYPGSGTDGFAGPVTGPLHLRWHVREVITAIIALAAGGLFIIAVGWPHRSSKRDQGE